MTDEQFQRLETLLEEGNALRRQALELQQRAMAEQAPLLQAQRRNLEQAEQVNQRAAQLQAVARRVQRVGIVALVLLGVLALWLSMTLFAR